MPRQPRIHVPGGFYHVTLRGNHRQEIFRHARERVLLNTIVARVLEKYGVGLHAYCWMTNHLHFLVRVGTEPLGRLMQQVASEYARAFQRNLGTTGHLFENRYYATLVDTDAYLLEALRYVHQNPVRAGLVAKPAQYRWSSHHAYVGALVEPWITTDFALALLSTDRGRAMVLYRAFVDALPPQEIADELASLDKGVQLLGKPEFVKRYTTPPPASTSLDAIIDDACKHFAVTVTELRSPARTARLVAARAWVAQSATLQGVATLTAIARALCRDESTLRHSMRRLASHSSDDQTTDHSGLEIELE